MKDRHLSHARLLTRDLNYSQALPLTPTKGTAGNLNHELGHFLYIECLLLSA